MRVKKFALLHLFGDANAADKRDMTAGSSDMGILDDLRAKFGALEQSEPVEPPGFDVGAQPHADSDDMLLTAAPDPEPLLEGLTIGISYEDGSGHVSERLVNCIRLVDAPDGRVLWAYCHLRKDFRAFLFARIKQIRDYRTGALTEDPARFFAPFMSRTAPGEALDSDLASQTTRDVLGLIGDELRILTFVAKADRYFDEREEALISDFIRQRVKQLDREVAENYDHGRVLNWMHAQQPTFEALERSVDRLSLRGEWELRALWDLSKDLVHVDERVEADELRAMDDLYTAIDHAIRDRRAEMD